MEPDLDIRSKKILTAYPLPTCTQLLIFLLLDQGQREDAHNTDFTQIVYLTLTFDSKIWFKVTKHPLTTSAVWMD